jgi:hypothetical protein
MTFFCFKAKSVVSADCSGIYVYTSFCADINIRTMVSGLTFPEGHRRRIQSVWSIRPAEIVLNE